MCAHIYLVHTCMPCVHPYWSYVHAPCTSMSAGRSYITLCTFMKIDTCMCICHVSVYLVYARVHRDVCVHGS